MKKLILLFVFAWLNLYESKAQVSTADFQFLQDLYNSTDGANWNNNTNWNFAGGPSSVNNSWYGLTVSGGRLTRVFMPNNKLNGTIPTSIGGATALEIIDLSLNQNEMGEGGLVGNIPQEIFTLPNLELLNLHFNNLSGNIPASVSSAISLRNINLGGNDLTGTIPNLSALSNLLSLELYQNQLTGNIPSNLPNSLTLIRLYSNNLTGTIPTTLPNSLQSLAIDDNQLTGTLPASLNSITSLTDIIASRNNLTGEIPNLSNLTALSILSLSENSLNDSTGIDFSANISLQQLYLNNNQLKGSLPVLPPNIEIVNLMSNRYSGSIPAAYGSLSNLQNLFLSNNRISGNIPDFSGASSLQRLYLSRNNLTGSIPDFSGVPSLMYLYLDENNLTGSIPASLWASNSITDISLSNNLLSGNITISTWGADRSFIGLSNNQLTGLVPVEFKNVSTLDLGNNLFTGFAPDAATFAGDMGVNFLNVAFNKMQFGDLEPLHNTLGNDNMQYAPQAPIGISDTLTRNLGETVTLNLNITGTPALISYQWFRNGQPISGANSSSYSFVVSPTTIGTYTCRATHQNLDLLTIERGNTTIRSTLTIGGRVTTAGGVNIAGIEVTLLQQRQGLPFLKVASTSTNANGEYSFVNEAEVGSPYTILASPANQGGDLSTYLGGSIFWQEAQIITPNANVNNANIILALNPTADDGFIEVSGNIIEEEEINDGQRWLMRGKKVAGTGVSMNQSTLDERSIIQRGNYVLKAFTRTDTAGKFSFPTMPRGKYFINVDFPGIPMDSTSSVKLDLNAVDKIDMTGLVYNDRIVMVINTATNVAPELGLQGLQVYPNPADKKIFVKLNNIQLRQVQFALCNTQGQIVRTWQPQAVSQEAIELPLAELEKGIYILQIKDIQTQRLFSPIRVVVSR
jgi:Leucine-rich repeat (LRR) protein